MSSGRDVTVMCSELPAPYAQGMARESGTLASWNDDRGFGFIVDETGQRTFVHISAFRSGRPVDGDRLTFEIERAPDGRFRAVNVVGAGRTSARGHPRRARGRVQPAAFVPILAFVGLYLVIVSSTRVELWVPAVYGALSVAAFALYAGDKRAAQRGSWRTSEAMLLLVGLLGGWPGAILAQQVLRHKTSKRSFQAVFWVSVVVNVGAFVLITTGWIAELSRIDLSE